MFYVGIGSTLTRPFSKDRGPCWRRYVRKHGAPDIEILDQDLEEHIAKARERELIAYYRRRRDGGSLVNITAGGDDQPMQYAEVRTKVSAALKGRSFTIETREKMSVSAQKRGMWRAWEGSARKRATGYNPMKSLETRRKVSLLTRGRKKSTRLCLLNGLVHSKPVDQWRSDGLFMGRWPNLRSVGRAFQCSAANIGMAAAGRTQTACGYVWTWAV